MDYIKHGEVVYVGEGWEKDFHALYDAGGTVKDRIVMAKTNRPYVVRRYAEKDGALGMIIISDSPFGSIRQITSQMGFEKGESLDNFGTSLPGVIVSRDSGEYLLSLISSKPVEINIEQNSTVEIKNSYNVIGCVHGETHPDEKVVIGAHYDTQLNIEGAWDNGSGCAALLEISRISQRSKPSRTMVFCAFGGEEIGLFGSTSFVRNREENLKNFQLYVNLDSTSGDICYIHELLATANALEVSRTMINQYTNWAITQSRSFTDFDHEQDSAEFVRCGVSTIWAHEEGNAFFHTLYDTIETINPEKLARATKVALLPFYYFANVKHLPF